MSEDRRMTLEEFEKELAIHGVDVALWPRNAVAAAVFVEGSAAARRALAEARLIEAALAEARRDDAPAPAALLERILADADDVASAREAALKPAPAARGGFLERLKRRVSFPALRPAAICAASALFGVWLGQSTVVADTAAALADGAETADALGLYENGGAEDLEIALAFQPDSEGWE